MGKIIFFILLSTLFITQGFCSPRNTAAIFLFQNKNFETIRINSTTDDYFVFKNKMPFNYDQLFVKIEKDSTLNLKRKQRRAKALSATFAFPFPFGFVGAHRVLLGTKPWVPVVYVATFGGCFGLLPLIDFCAIVFDKSGEKYLENDNVFMWIN